MNRIQRRDFISKVSQHTEIRADVVEEVLEGIVDVAVEEIINKGNFGIKDFFSISAFEWGGYNLSDKKIAPQKRLKVRLSEKIRKLWKLSNSDETYSDGAITKDNWKDALKYASTDSKQKEQKAIVDEEENLLNFLNEDEI